MRKNYFLESDIAEQQPGGFNNALKNGFNFVMRNKGKFIGGGAVLGLVEESVRKFNVIKHGFKLGDPSSAWNSCTQTLKGGKFVNESTWDMIKRYYNNLFRSAGGAAGAATSTATGWFDKVKAAFSNVFSKGWEGFKNAPGLDQGIVWGIIAVVLVVLTWIAYKIIKKIRARRQTATTESYVSLLSDQSFLEAKQVAYYLKENTAMSKKDCNKIANFVYKKSLNRKLNNLI